MTPSWRKPAGTLAILLFIIVWCVLVVTLAGNISRWHWSFQAIFYLIAGIAWITPLKPALLWMETGRWR